MVKYVKVGGELTLILVSMERSFSQAELENNIYHGWLRAAQVLISKHCSN